MILKTLTHTVLHLYTKQMTGPFTNSHHRSVLVSRETGDKQLPYEGVADEMFHPGHTELIRELLVRPAGGQRKPRAQESLQPSLSHIQLPLLKSNS